MAAVVWIRGMTVLDKDLQRHHASIYGDSVRVHNSIFTPESLQTFGLQIVDCSSSKESMLRLRGFTVVPRPDFRDAAPQQSLY